MFCLSFDVDWASDELIEYSITPVVDAGLPATIFATHKSDYLLELLRQYPSQIEIGLHPNYLPFFSEKNFNWESQLKVLKKIYPSAIGVRSHGHFVSSKIIDHYIDLGMKYESGIYVDNKPLEGPLPYQDKFCRLSHFFQDDAHLTRKRDLTLNSINLNEPGIKIFDFHPIHIFLNSPSIEFYQSSKINFHNFELLKKDIFDGVGIRDIFLEVIKLLSLKKNSVFKLRDII